MTNSGTPYIMDIHQQTLAMVRTQIYLTESEQALEEAAGLWRDASGRPAFGALRKEADRIPSRRR